AAQNRARNALPQDVERLHQRQARLEERGELLVEDQELRNLDVAASGEAELEAANLDASLAMHREEEEALFFELRPQACLALGDVRRLHDLATRRGYPAVEFHSLSGSATDIR